jgi:hypothetical protein
MTPLYIYIFDKDTEFCEHINTEYQPEEKDTNAPESLNCVDCGKELDPPEPDYDAELKESPLAAGFLQKDYKRNR